MHQWFEESSYDVIASSTANEDGKWQPVAVFSDVQSRGQYKRPISTCQWDRCFDSEELARDAAIEWARLAVKNGKVSLSLAGRT
ncbi:hypothetical protein ACO2Q9_19110 [Variovorax sp. VNK109]|uniref:hypothetical protein n=1 Tax=Variovorax sp. VNK109 TaxID=3400919 RepID=UPI003BFAF608